MTEEDIKEFLMKEYIDKGLMPKWWLPDKVVFVDEIPKTSTGKMDKKKLREIRGEVKWGLLYIPESAPDTCSCILYACYKRRRARRMSSG